MVASKHTQAEQ